MREIEEAIALLRRRPGAAAKFMKPTVETIVNVALARGFTIHGED